jgi:hypothetical protein
MKPPVCLRRVVVVTIFLAAGLLVVGCDDPAGDIPQAVLDQQARQAEAAKNLPKVPTTQELLSGPRTLTPLGPLPMTMRVPVSWKVEVAGPASHLRGRTPSGDEVTIQLNSRAPIKRAEFESFIKSEKKAQSERPQSILKADVRPFGDAQLYEYQRVGEPREWPVYEGTGGQIRTRTTTEQPFDWKIIVFDPQGDAFQRHELNFIGLTRSQYDKDQNFLRGILDTLSSGEAAGGAASPTTIAPTDASPAPSPATLP